MNGFWVIGFRGAGKTTMGRELAQRLGFAFLDIDESLEASLGESIPSFVERQGLEAFRREEEKALEAGAKRLELGERLVVATGGGFVDWEASFRMVEASLAPKLYLELPAEQLWERLKNQPDRQKIGNLNTFSRLEECLAGRRLFYEKIATIYWKDQDINGCLAALKKHQGEL